MTPELYNLDAFEKMDLPLNSIYCTGDTDLATSVALLYRDFPLCLRDRLPRVYAKAKDRQKGLIWLHATSDRLIAVWNSKPDPHGALAQAWDAFGKSSKVQNYRGYDEHVPPVVREYLYGHKKSPTRHFIRFNSTTGEMAIQPAWYGTRVTPRGEFLLTSSDDPISHDVVEYLLMNPDVFSSVTRVHQSGNVLVFYWAELPEGLYPDDAQGYVHLLLGDDFRIIHRYGSYTSRPYRSKDLVIDETIRTTRVVGPTPERGNTL